MSADHVNVPKRERHDPGRVLYWLLRDDLPRLYTVRMPGDRQSFVRVPRPLPPLATSSRHDTTWNR